jgi:hypothetical protein
MMTQRANPPAAWLIPTVLFTSALLAVVLIGSAVGTPRPGDSTDAVVPKQLTIGMIIGASAPEVVRTAVSASATAVERKYFAFGYLEFDWDPNAPDGMPGFDSWPS